MIKLAASSLLLVCFLSVSLQAAEVTLDGQTFTVPEGMTVQRVAGPPLVDRPIHADFDEQGRLYVLDSSGSSAQGPQQLEEKTHQIVQLTDTDQDGVFDKRTVFADKFMLPEGACWYDGSLYVAAPPEIWKLTDENDDGIADRREVWFDGKTLTGCANDLHGPYLGPDGYLYWAKGAFAEQNHDLLTGDSLNTRAAHLFRRHPSGGPLGNVMTGGMDNPVEIVFTPDGERIFTTTFLEHPQEGRRDGLIHAVYGGVYGKDHGVLNGVPRTGELMPALVQQGASAPCGLARLESSSLGSDYLHNVLSCSFNKHRIFRHQIGNDGGMLTSKNSEFLVSDSPDFHPTDVFEDADGSVLVINTGGWYKICCPTSQFYRPEVLGGIYRVKKIGHQNPHDPRGNAIDWNVLSVEQLVQLLGDQRFIIRNRARKLLGEMGENSVATLHSKFTKVAQANHRLQIIWALCQNQTPSARKALQIGLDDNHETVVHATLHSISLHLDKSAAPAIRERFNSFNKYNQRIAAECLGRIGSAVDVPLLLNSLTSETDRALEHSLIYAAIEIGDTVPIKALLNSNNIATARGALIALDQIPDNDLQPEFALSAIQAEQPSMRTTGWWLLANHPEWAALLPDYFRQQIQQDIKDVGQRQLLLERLSSYINTPEILKMSGELMHSGNTATQTFVLEAISNTKLATVPESITNGILRGLNSADADTLTLAVQAANAIRGDKPDQALQTRLLNVYLTSTNTPTIRLAALSAIPPQNRPLNADTLNDIQQYAGVSHPLQLQSLTVDLLVSSPWPTNQWREIPQVISTLGSIHLRRLVTTLAKTNEKQTAINTLNALIKAPAATTLNPDEIQKLFEPLGTEVVAKTSPLIERIKAENRERITRIDKLLGQMDLGDVTRGQKVFQSTKAACTACHRIAYLGGRVGPDLTRIGQIRTERDLLEAVLFPSASFVQSFEPVSIITNTGQIYSGVIRDDNGHTIVLQLDAQKQIRLLHSEIEQQRASATSIMPAGLDKHLSDQQLVDLIKFLKASQ
ncbi:MAG: dehydrogenase [Planctomycetaceae bacterium]|nr:dehydrogenase [Planctomycetaceae bacterium]|tara:strand:+ start:1961 stop:5050 length:3090 start_codon:yes stop_codon:yes gene_type:complete